MIDQTKIEKLITLKETQLKQIPLKRHITTRKKVYGDIYNESP